MTKSDAVVAVFAAHQQADAAITNCPQVGSTCDSSASSPKGTSRRKRPSDSTLPMIVGGLHAFGGAMFSLGIPKGSAILHEQDLQADGFLIVARGPVEDMARTKSTLASLNPVCVDLQQDTKPMAPLPDDHAGHGAAA